MLKPPVFVMKTGGFWPGILDSNPRLVEPKTRAIPNCTKTGYIVKDIPDVVKHVVKILPILKLRTFEKKNPPIFPRKQVGFGPGDRIRTCGI